MSQAKAETPVASEPAPAKPQFGTWTPITVAMPTRGKPVLIRIRGRGWDRAHYNAGPHDLWSSTKGVAYVNGEDVDAWMPGPPM